MRPFKIKIAPGADYELAAVGDYVRIKSSAVAVTVTADDANESGELDQGDDLLLTPFTRLRLSHQDAAEQDVTVYIGKGTRAGSSKVGGSIAISNLPANNGAFTSTAKTVTNASGQLLAANAARRFLMVQNNHATGYVYVNLAGVAATVANSIKVAPGASLFLDVFAPNGAILAIGDIASNTSVVVVEG